MIHYATLDDFLQDVPPHLDPLRGHDALFRLQTKQGRCCDVRLQDGDITVTEAGTATPVCTVVADEQALLDLIAGQASPMKLLMSRQVVVQGDARPLMRLIALLK